MRFLAQNLVSSDNQQHQHTSILRVFGSSDKRVLLTMLPAKLNHSHGTAAFRYSC